MHSNEHMKLYVILHNIRSAHNVGSIFRTADGAGVAKIFLTGYTPAPTDRFGRTQEDMRKTALGATESVAWESSPELDGVIGRLRKEKCAVVAVEQHARAIDYRTHTVTGNTAFIFGNEIDGVPADVCADADRVLMIPMRGEKESLNVAVAAGIILFRYAEGAP